MQINANFSGRQEEMAVTPGLVRRLTASQTAAEAVLPHEPHETGLPA